MIRLSTISFIIISISCNSNPFWEDPKKNEFNLSGIAYGENNETDVPVSIWIETLDQYTTTGPGGYFSIPITNIQSSFGQFSGPVKLYYFIYNYRLDSSTVFFTNGMFSKYQTDFSSNGELLNSIVLKKILSGKMELNLNENTFYDQERVHLTMDLKIHLGVTVDAFKVIWEGLEFHTGLIFRAIIDNNVIVSRFVRYDDDGNTIIDELNNFTYYEGESITWNYYFLNNELDELSGVYEIFPYFSIRHGYLPAGLVSALGGDSTFSISRHYLKLPSDIVSDTITID